MNQNDLLASGRLLPVMEEFFSLQGEGFHTGEAAWFIRIGGCDVGCAWCDVKESWNAGLFPPVDTDVVVERALKCEAGAVIVTGGEPLLYNLTYLCDRLKDNDSRDQAAGVTGPSPAGVASDPATNQGSSSQIRTFLETSGSQPLSGTWDWICLSPKREWLPLEEFYTLSQELKVIIHDDDDFDWAELQAGKMNPAAHRFLQPEWSQRDIILPRIIRYIEKHPGWRLSLQTHKYIGIP